MMNAPRIAVDTRAATEQFIDAIRSAGIVPPKLILDDGRIHRFSSSGKRGDDAGWYVYYPDGIPAGSFGCWRSGLNRPWHLEVARPLSAQEDSTYRIRIEAMRQQREADDAQRKADASKRAASMWDSAQPAPDDHPYLAKKGVKAHGLRVQGSTLVIPMRDEQNVLHSIQTIDPNAPPDRQKRFLTGGRVTGCYFVIGTPEANGRLCICEGFATGASVNEATGHAVVVAFNSGNLESVARTMRHQFPNSPIAICADDDAETAGNPGLTKAREAAKAVGAAVAVPVFAPNRPNGATDFNDMAKYCGQETVGRAIADAFMSNELNNHIVDFDDMPSLDETHPHIIEKWIPQDEVTLLAAHGGAGKSFIALFIAICVALGLPFAGLQTKKANALFYSAEDGKRTLLRRVAHICHLLKVEARSLKEKLILIDASDLDPALHREQRGKFSRDNCETPMVAKLAALVKQNAAELVVIDNASDAYDDDEIKRARVREFVRSLRQNLARPDRAVLLLAHVNKVSATNGRGAGSEDYSGSTAWHNSSRSRISLSLEKAGGETVGVLMTHMKATHGPLADEIRFEWRDGVLVPDTFPADECVTATKQIVEAARALQEKADMDAVVALIADCDHRGQRVTASTTGPATMFKLLKVDRKFPKHLTADKFNTLVRDAEDAGLIYRRTVRDAHRKLREVFTCVPESGAAAETAPIMSTAPATDASGPPAAAETGGAIEA